MWRPGKWVYVEEDSHPANGHDSAAPDDSFGSVTLDPPSPPWKLGQVPVETAVFKDGRRMSKRFEKLNREKEEKDKQRPQAPVATRKERSKSIVSGSGLLATDKKPPDHHPPRRPRKSSIAPVHTLGPASLSAKNSIEKSPSNQPRPESENEPPFPQSRPTELSPSSLKRACQKTLASDSYPTLISPTTVPGDASLPRASSDGARPLSTQVNQITPQKTNVVPNELNQSHIETFSKTESVTSEPHTPPAIGVHLEAFVSTSSTSPHSPVPPLKKFKPWEALKSIQTDGAEVASDLKLIHEGHLRSQNKPATAHVRCKRAAVSSTGAGGVADSQTLTSLHSFSLLFPGRTIPEGGLPTKRHSPHSSSDLTELSSSLSDLSDEDSDCVPSTTSSMVYSESDVDDDCLPESMVRIVRRPSTAMTSKSDSVKWRKRRSVALHRAKRAMRSMIENRITTDGADDPAPPPYTKIKANVYPYRKPELSELPPAFCGCIDGGCGEKCLNRAMFYLCDPKRCQLGQSCTNIPFNQRKDIIDESTTRLGKGLQVFYTGPQRGWGLRTEIKLKRGIFLIDYRGEVISRENCYKRVLNDYRGMKHFYFLDYDGSDVIDAGKKGNCSRFINHSCDPNLRVERFKLSGLEEYQFGLFTLRDIQIGEELCYDYGWQNFSDIAPTSNMRTSISPTSAPIHTHGPAKQPGEDELISTATAPTVQKCFCGASNCKGFLGIKKSSSIRSSLGGPSRRVRKGSRGVRRNSKHSKTDDFTWLCQIQGKPTHKKSRAQKALVPAQGETSSEISNRKNA